MFAVDLREGKRPVVSRALGPAHCIGLPGCGIEVAPLRGDHRAETGRHPSGGPRRTNYAVGTGKASCPCRALWAQKRVTSG